MIKTVNNCRLCDSSNIKTVFDFGLSPLANAFKSKEDLEKKELQFPLAYFKCCDCHSVQLKHEVDSSILFKEYLYESPPNLIPHFRELAKTTFDFLELKKDSLVVDIGSNNGILLKEYQNLGCKVYGVEPAKNVADKARNNGVPTFNEFFNKDFGQYIVAENLFPDLITCTNCFAHLSDLNDFVAGLSIAMPENGHFIFENAYLVDTLKNRDFGQAYFEHFYMHSVTPLVKLFDKHGLELFRIEEVDVQMGSIRGYVRRKENRRKSDFPEDETTESYTSHEIEIGLTEPNLYIFKNFINDILGQKISLLLDLALIRSKKQTVSVYGWPAKMTLINKYFGLEKYIDYVIEESPVKTGKYCPGTKLEIKSLDYFKNNPTDICLIGAYNFEKDIKNKNQWYKGEWILPL